MLGRARLWLGGVNARDVHLEAKRLPSISSNPARYHKAPRLDRYVIRDPIEILKFQPKILKIQHVSPEIVGAIERDGCR